MSGEGGPIPVKLEHFTPDADGWYRVNVERVDGRYFIHDIEGDYSVRYEIVDGEKIEVSRVPLADLRG